LIEALQQRMQTPEAKELYRLRRQTVELVNADFKEHRNFRRFSGRGRSKANAEVGLQVLVNNLLVCVAYEKLDVPSQPPMQTPQKTAA